MSECQTFKLFLAAAAHFLLLQGATVLTSQPPSAAQHNPIYRPVCRVEPGACALDWQPAHRRLACTIVKFPGLELPLPLTEGLPLSLTDTSGFTNNKEDLEVVILLSLTPRTHTQHISVGNLGIRKIFTTIIYTHIYTYTQLSG